MAKKHFYIINSIGICLLLISTTLPLWKAHVGGFDFLLFLFLILSYLCLAIVLLVQILFLVKKKNRNKYRIQTIVLLFAVLALVAWNPFGINNVDKLQGYDYLTAKTGGTKDTFDAMMTLKLNKDGQYRQTYAVFGTSEVRGTYTVKGDTIFFNRTTSYHDYEDYQFAVLEDYPLGNARKDTFKNCLMLYRNSINPQKYLMHPQGKMLQDMKKK